ncbi:hypothetical protein ACWFNS_07415 [Oerskovia enterophila]
MSAIIYNGLTYQVSDNEAQSINDLMERVMKGIEAGFTWVLTYADTSGEVPIQSRHKIFVSSGTDLTLIDWP